MISWRLVLLVVVCVILDFGSPFTAGAFRFSADDSLESLSSPAGRIPPGWFAAPPPLIPMRDSTVRPLDPGRGLVGRGQERWVAELRKYHVSISILDRGPLTPAGSVAELWAGAGPLSIESPS